MSDHAKTVLLFYDGYEVRAADSLPGFLYAQARRGARYAVRNLRGLQVRTGFYTAFRSLAKSLRVAGYEVRVNDFDFARAHPAHPIGLCGYPSVLEKTDALANPRIFGPGDFGPPNGVAAVAADERFKILTHPSSWFVELYRPYCGDKLAVMFVGIDLHQWRSWRDEPKTLDFVIYDKLRWYRDERVPAILERVQHALDARGLSHETLRYGHHNLAHFRATLKPSRAMIFLCEHETQGLAYQEAMAADVPILAWDEGIFVDPGLAPFAQTKLDVKTAPYFDERCGMTFKLEDFEEKLEAFQRARDGFAPRAYVSEALSLPIAAKTIYGIVRRLAVSHQVLASVSAGRWARRINVRRTVLVCASVSRLNAQA